MDTLLFALICLVLSLWVINVGYDIVMIIKRIINQYRKEKRNDT